MLKAVIVEDELNGLNNLKTLLAKHCGDIEIIGEARTVEEGKALLNNSDIKPDVAFLDISLPDGLVFKLLNQLRPIKFEVYFCYCLS